MTPLFFSFCLSQKPVGRLSHSKSQIVKGATAPCVRFFVITFGQSRDPITCEDKKESDIKMIKRLKRDNKKTLIKIIKKEKRRSQKY